MTKSKTILTTKRLILRPLKLNDSKIIINLITENVAKYF
jgi:hypothetical protein